MNKNIHVLARAVILDQGHILLCKTQDLPKNFYFLPGGHVEHGESVEEALIRELKEETGAEATIKRFLGCLEFSFDPGHSSICHNHEYNFVFEAEAIGITVETKLPQLEKHITLVWMDLFQLKKIDFRAEPLKELLFTWISEEGKSNLFQSVMKG